LTTLSIDDDVLSAAKELAAIEKKSGSGRPPLWQGAHLFTLD